jgi:preprotein translocase subunit SecY
MVSAAEQLAANLNFGAFSKATELKKRLWFTLGALLVYRLGTYIPIPGINHTVLKMWVSQANGGIFDLFNTFSGGAAGNAAIFALGIMPYISASIIVQLLTAVSPQLAALKKEGEAGRKIINQYTRYGTVVLAIVQAYAIAIGMATQSIDIAGMSQKLASDGGTWFFILTTTITFVGGTVFLMWLGEQITARGIGNGISLIIFAGIVANLPSSLYQLFQTAKTDNAWSMVFFVLVGGLVLIAVIVFMERAQRRLLVQYPKRQVGNKMFQGDSSHLPLKLNSSGVIPPIFASALLIIPTTFGLGGGEGWGAYIASYLGPGQTLHLVLYVFLIVFFAFFYTAIVFDPKDTADNLKKHGGFLPGIRPGPRTAEYIDYVLTRITVVGAIYLSVVCVIPEILRGGSGVSLALGGTSLLIVVSVTMDTVAQIQSHLLAHQYEGLIKKAKLRGSRR